MTDPEYNYFTLLDALQSAPEQRVPFPGALIIPEVGEESVSVNEIGGSFRRMYEWQKNLCIHVAFEMALDTWEETLDRAEELGLTGAEEPQHLRRITEHLENTNRIIGLMEQAFIIFQSFELGESRERPWDSVLETALSFFDDDQLRLEAYTLAFGGGDESITERNIGNSWYHLLLAMKAWAHLNLTSASPRYFHLDMLQREIMWWNEVLEPLMKVYLAAPVEMVGVVHEEQEIIMDVEMDIALNEWWAECKRRLPIRYAEHQDVRLILQK